MAIDDSKNEDFQKQSADLRKLEQEINKKSNPTSKKQLRALKKLKTAYAVQAKAVKKLGMEIRKLNSEKTHLTKVTEQLASKFGGTAGQVTKFTGGLKDAIFSVDKGSQTMKVFGMQTGITSSAFAGMAAKVNLAATAVVAYLDWVDKLEKKQGQLQRALGATNVSMGAQPRIMARGWGIAGSEGKKAAKELVNVVGQARKGLWDDLAGETGQKGGMDQLVTMTAGMSKQVPQWAKAMSETFAETSGQGMIDSMMKIGIVAKASNVPIDQFSNMVFDLAKEFVHLGMDVDDATAAVSVFVDEMGKGAIAPAVGLSVMRNIIQQQSTAAGLQGRFMTAAFADQNFNKLDVGTQNTLNDRAKEITNNPNATWGSLDIGQQATTLKSLDKGSYAQVMRGLYEFLKTMPEIVSTAIAPQVIGQEMDTAKIFWENLKTDMDIGEQYAAQTATPTDKFKDAADDFAQHIKDNAEKQAEFYSCLMETLDSFAANMADVAEAFKDDGISGAVNTYGRGVLDREAAADVAAEKRIKGYKAQIAAGKGEEGGLFGGSTEDMLHMEEELLRISKEQRSGWEKFFRLFIPESKGANIAAALPARVFATAEDTIATPKGTFKSEVSIKFIGDLDEPGENSGDLTQEANN